MSINKLYNFIKPFDYYNEFNAKSEEKHL